MTDPWAAESVSRGKGTARIAVAVIVGAVLTAIVLAIALSGPRPPPGDVVGVHEGQFAPDFTILDVNGTAWRLADHRGEVVLLDFMGVFCISCEEEMTRGTMQGVHGRHSAEGFTILSVDVGGPLGTEDPLAAWRFLRGVDSGGTYRWEEGGWTIALDNQGLGTTYQVGGLPDKLLLDRDGRIVWRTLGIVVESDLEARVQALL